MAGRRRRGTPRVVGLMAAGAAAAVAVGIIALSSGGSAGSGAQPSPAVSVAPASGIVRAGDAAPEFSGTATSGGSIDLAALRGKVVLISFFASWCTNCREDLPRVQAAAVGHASRGLAVVPVSYRETGDARAFLQSVGITIPALIDPTDRVGDTYGIIDLPVTVWVGRDGHVASVVHGQLTQQALDTELAALGV
jgi:cytochrome c biogenesis protein CcmG, thiol:disulfide interchange protein DsbE